MRLETERLLIRRFRAEDWKDLHAYLSDAEVVRYEPYGVFSEEDAIREALRRSEDTDFWAVCLKDDRLIGNIYFAPQQAEEFRTWEIGFVFSARYQKQGYASEACRRILRLAFEELGAHRVIGLCNPQNTASFRLMERLNMRREGHFLKPAFFEKTAEGAPQWHDAYQYAVLDEEWRKALEAE